MSRTTHPSRRRRWFIAGLLVAPLFLLAGAEVLLRSLWPQPTRGFSGNLFIQREGLTFLAPGAVGTQLTREFHVRVEGNAAGYRQGTWTEDQGGECVWLFGDSFAFGWGVEAGQSAAAILGRGRAVKNFGMPGDGWGDYGRRLELALAAHPAPSQIVVLTYDNDLADRGASPAARGDGVSDPPPVLRDRLLRFHLVRLAARWADGAGFADTLARAFGHEDRLGAIYRKDLEIHQEAYFQSPRWEGCRGDIREFLRQARGTGAGVLVFRIPAAFANGHGWQQEAVGRSGLLPTSLDFSLLESRVRAEVEAGGGVFGSLGPLSDAQTRDLYFRHDMHLTALGQGKLAACLEACLGKGSRGISRGENHGPKDR